MRNNNLIGTWKSDPNDVITQENYGNVMMEFRGNGELIYTIIEKNKEQKMLMTYEINGSYLITDQSSFPQRVETEFVLDVETGRLELIFDGITSKYIKIN